ncbi:MAG: MMPL family transporter, partial [Spirochaetales bacterium]|nr:MMPL family transporter [Spirochaetales bacterium]
GGAWYVLIQGSLSPAGDELDNGNSVVEKIYKAAEGITAQSPETHFVFSGVPFHTYESSSRAQKEISLISTISLIVLALILLYVFRSPLPVLVSLGAAAFSLFLASAAVLLAFREIHTLTFIFGTSLIGMCADYSLHYFVHWKANLALKTGGEIRKHLMRSIGMSFVSSEVCFAAMLFAPFMILRQFAVFSLAGLASSFLTAVCLYPYIKPPKADNRRLGKAPFLCLFAVRLARRIPRRAVFPVTAALLLVLLFVNRGALRIENNISGLYTMSASLRESETLAAQVLNSGARSWYFIVSGDNPQDLLRHEEELTSGMEAFMAASLFIPSAAAQEISYAAAKNLLPLAEEQAAYLGLPAESAALFRRDFAAAAGRFITPGGDIPSYLASLISPLWIGETGGRCYSCVLPLAVEDEEPLRKLAGKFDFVFFVNMAKDIGTELDRLTRAMLLLFLAAWVAVCVIIRLFYSWKDTVRICSVPVFLALVTAAVLACRGIALGFFPVAAFVLVFGLGLDYIFYMMESRKARGRPLTISAVILSFATTALSFGALGLSSFAPVHIFGLVVFAGLSAAFIFAMLASGSVSGENQRTSGPDG